MFEEKTDFAMRQRLTPQEADRFNTLAAMLIARFEQSASRHPSADDLEVVESSKEGIEFIIEGMAQDGRPNVPLILPSMKSLQSRAIALEGYKEGSMPMGLKLSKESCELAFQLRNVAIAVFDPTQDPKHLDFANAADVTQRVQSASDPKAAFEKILTDTAEAFNKPFTPLVIRANNFTG